MAHALYVLYCRGGDDINSLRLRQAPVAALQLFLFPGVSAPGPLLFAVTASSLRSALICSLLLRLGNPANYSYNPAKRLSTARKPDQCPVECVG
jgi:hypothetical protein